MRIAESENILAPDVPHNKQIRQCLFKLELSQRAYFGQTTQFIAAWWMGTFEIPLKLISINFNDLFERIVNWWIDFV